MLLVSLTGGIATGKSVVAQVFENLGCYIHKADLVAHSLIEPGKPAWKKILARFGPSIQNEDKTINRKKLGSIVFASEEDRLFVNDVIHPLVLKAREAEIKKLKGQGNYKIFMSEEQVP